MLLVNDELTVVHGPKATVLAEVTCVLHEVYEKMKECEGEEKALEQLAEIGRLAVMTADEIEEATMDMIRDLVN